MKKRVVLLIAIIGVFLLAGCFKLTPVSQFETEDAVFVLRNGVIEVTANRQLSGLDVFMKAVVKESDVTLNGTFSIVKQLEDGTAIATAIGGKYFSKGEAVMTIRGGFKDLKTLGIETIGVRLEEEYGPQSQLPVNGVYVQDAWVQSDTSGCFFMIGARNIDSTRPVVGIDLVLSYNTDHITVTGVESLIGDGVIKDFDISTSGKIKISIAFDDASTFKITAPTNLFQVNFTSKNVKVTSEVSFDSSQFIVYTGDQEEPHDEVSASESTGFITIGNPVLLGDFDLSGEVGLADLNLFKPYYRTSSGDADFDSFYDIGPAVKAYGGDWANIYTEAKPDSVIDLFDLVILAQNWEETKPDGFNYVKTLAELNAAIASSRFSPIVLGANIDGSAGISTVSRIVDINLNGYTLTGDLSFNTDESGTINLYAGTITGDLTVNAPNATFNNYANVTGNVVINDISGSTWNEYANGNKIVWDAENKTLHVFGAVASVTVNNTGSTITGAGNIGKLIIPEGVSVSVDEAPQSVDLPDQTIWNPTKGEFYSTISNAIDGASAGDTIFVGSGEYIEIFQINKQGIKLIGEGYEDPSCTKINGAIAVTKANIEIDGFMISGGGVVYSNAKAGIYLVGGTTGHKINGNKLVGNGNDPADGPGILFGYNASNVEISSNVIISWYQGMYINPSSNIVIEENTLESNYVGIGSDGLNDVSIVRNQFKNNEVEDWGSSNVGVDVSAQYNTFIHGEGGEGSNCMAVAHYSGNMINATCNWWGSIDPVVIAGKVSGLVNWSPFWISDEGPCDGNAPVRNITTGLPYTTIQAAVDSASEGHEIEVNDGTYSENVTINKNIKLLSRNGRDFTRIVGMNESGLGTIDVLTGTNGLQIGDHGKGFEIVGINGNGAIEKAAIYFRGSHTNAKIIGNKVVANGDAGLMAEYNAGVTDFLIEGNIFSGKTFVGDYPEGEGFVGQFGEGSNYPRQLVVFGGGASGTNTQRITFKNNLITGTAGGINEEGAEQGNTLVTIDADGSVITGNDFEGVTSRYGTSLRARRSCTIQGNTFHSDRLTNTAGHLFVQNQGKTLDEIASDNTFDRHVFISGSDTIGHKISPFLLAAIQGKTVKVGAGNYDEAITITDKTDITIQGAGSDQTFIESPAGSDTIKLEGVSNVVIKDIGFKRNADTYGDRAVQMTGSNEGITIENCAFTGTYYVTIQGNVNGLTVKNCSITDVKSGINLQYGTNLVVENTDIGVVAQGIENDTYCVRFGSSSGEAENLTITGCEFNVDKNGLIATEGTYHSAIIVRAAATGTLAADESKILGEVVNLSSTSLNAAYNYWGHATGPEEGQIKGTGTVVYAPYYTDEEMTDPVLAVFRFDSDAELVGWYTDRTEPAAFTTVSFNGDHRLKHSISESPLPSTEFYQYTGKKLDTPEAAYYSIELYIPADWENSKTVRAGIWATGKDSDDVISLYPIVEFTNNPKDDNDSASPRFRVWPVDASDGDWIDIPTDITYNSWYTLTMELDTSENEVTFTVGDNSITLGANGTVQLANVILQGHNPLPSGATYDIYWDNLIIKP